MLPNQQLTETTAEQNKLAETPSKKPAKAFFNYPFKGKINVNPAWIIRYIFPFTILIIIGILFWFFYFLYNNVYMTMAQATIVTDLKTKVISEQLSKDKFAEVIKKLAEKSSLALWNKAGTLKTPFEFGERNNYLTTPTSTISITATSTSSTLPVITSTTNPTSTTNTPLSD